MEVFKPDQAPALTQGSAQKASTQQLYPNCLVMPNNSLPMLDIMSRAKRIQDWLIDDEIPLSIVGGLIARGGLGKSWFGLELALCVASKRCNDRLLQLSISKHGKVVILNAEDDAKQAEDRVNSIGRYLNDSEAFREVNENVVYFPLAGEDVDIMSESWSHDIEVVTKGARLIIIDTYRMWSGGADENDNAGQTKILKRLFRFVRNRETTILFLHHPNKSSGNSSDAGAASGAGAITSNSRYQAYMLPLDEDELIDCGIEGVDASKYVCYGRSKGNYSASTGKEMWFRRTEEGVLVRDIHFEQVHAPILREAKRERLSAIKQFRKRGEPRRLSASSSDKNRASGHAHMAKKAQAQSKENQQNSTLSPTSQSKSKTLSDEWLEEA